MFPMPRLILINGLPAAGKSTLAEMLADDHPMMLVIDIDLVRGMLGGWSEQPRESGIAARRIAIEMARTHLASGLDVVVPQFLGRIEYVQELERLSRDTDAAFREVVLRSASSAVAAEQFRVRSQSPETKQHRDAAAGLTAGGDFDEFREMQERLDGVIELRSATIEVATVHGDRVATYQRLLAGLR